jgi:hypothetical protein
MSEVDFFEMSSMSETMKIVQNELSIRFSKLKWSAYINLFEDLSVVGLVYGGAPRDYITRTYAAKDYYNYCTLNNINANENYCNKNIHPETYADRNLFPKDIDVFITESEFDKFIAKNSENYSLKRKDVTTTNYFFQSNDLFKRAIIYKKYTCNFMKFLNGFHMKMMMGIGFDYYSRIPIDFIIIKDEFLERSEYTDRDILYPPFGNPDFDVNELSFKHDEDGGFICKPLPYLTNQMHNLKKREKGYQFNPLAAVDRNYEIMQNVIKNIRGKKALLIFPDIDEYITAFGNKHLFSINYNRVNKMLFKGYTINKFELIIPPKYIIWAPNGFIYDEIEEEKCLICFETFQEGNRWFKSCGTCNAKMHQLCFTRFLQRHNTDHNTQRPNIKCPQCRENINIGPNCVCKYLTYFNSIDAVYNSKKSSNKCIDCGKKIPNNKDICDCWIIHCSHIYRDPDINLFE